MTIEIVLAITLTREYAPLTDVPRYVLPQTGIPPDVPSMPDLADTAHAVDHAVVGFDL